MGRNGDGVPGWSQNMRGHGERQGPSHAGEGRRRQLGQRWAESFREVKWEVVGGDQDVGKALHDA